MVKRKPSCIEQIVDVADDTKEICCPPKGHEMWNAHPRVYLTFAPGQQEVQCYYCGTRYRRKR